MRHGLKVSAQMATLTVRVEEQTEFNHSEKHGNNNFYELSISHTITAALIVNGCHCNGAYSGMQMKA